jgi:hypothetical protein
MLNNGNSLLKNIFLGILTELGFALGLFLLMAFVSMIAEILSR